MRSYLKQLEEISERFELSSKEKPSKDALFLRCILKAAIMGLGEKKERKDPWVKHIGTIDDHTRDLFLNASPSFSRVDISGIGVPDQPIATPKIEPPSLLDVPEDDELPTAPRPYEKDIPVISSAESGTLKRKTIDVPSPLD